MTRSSPLLSIITITRNNAGGFQKTHESLRAQSIQDYEWIIVDGKSTDGTLPYIEKNNLWPCTVSEPDAGIYQAMNKGMERAKGDYLLFLNAGDTLADIDILSTLLQSLDTMKPDFLYADALEDRIGQRPHYKKARRHTLYILGMFTHHQSMVYKKSILNGLRYDENYKIAADYGFTVSFLKKAKNIVYMPCALCLFESGGISQQQKGLGRKEQYRIRRQLSLCPAILAAGIQAAQAFSAKIRKIISSN